MSPHQQRSRRKRQNRKQRRREQAMQVAIYDCNREYGGPEEGGWWYDTGSLVSREGTFWNRSNAWREANRMNAWCEADNTANQRRPIYSVLCNGVLGAYVMPYPAPAGFPQRTPRYE